MATRTGRIPISSSSLSITDQVPKGDLSRDLAKKHNFAIHETIAGCLTLGGKTLAVDAVLSIGEHGSYPTTTRARSSTLAGALRGNHRCLRSEQDGGPRLQRQAPGGGVGRMRWMYDRARTLYVPFLAGSSVPVTWRKPDLVLPRPCELTGGGADRRRTIRRLWLPRARRRAGMVERRKGGETGVSAVTCHTGGGCGSRSRNYLGRGSWKRA